MTNIVSANFIIRNYTVSSSSSSSPTSSPFQILISIFHFEISRYNFYLYIWGYLLYCITKAYIYLSVNLPTTHYLSLSRLYIYPLVGPPILFPPPPPFFLDLSMQFVLSASPTLHCYHFLQSDRHLPNSLMLSAFICTLAAPSLVWLKSKPNSNHNHNHDHLKP